MFKKAIWFLIVVLVGFFGTIYVLNIQKPELEEEEEEILEVIDFSPDAIKSKAVLFVREGSNQKDLELLLNDFVNTYNVPIVKVELTDKVEEFIGEQESILEEHYPKVVTLGEKMMTKKDGSIEFDEGLNELLMKTLAKLDSGEDVKKDIKKIVKKSNLDKDEVDTYLNSRLKLSEVILEKPIAKESTPTLILFDENREFERIDALKQEKETLTWLLISKGIIDLTKEDQVSKVLKDINEEELIVAFGTSTCPYCVNTTPIVEEVTKEKGITYHYIDIEAFSNMGGLNTLIADHLGTDIESTPTVVHIKNGKEVSRFVGQQDKLSVEKFIRDSQEMASQKEVLEDTEKDDEEKPKENKDTEEEKTEKDKSE